jgi:FtsH-binding integral membrane protein
MNLLLATALLLISAIAVGLYLVFLGLRQRKRSSGLALAHAGLALSGIVVLFTEIFTSPTDKMNNVAALFLLFALVGGGMVFALHEKNRPPSMAAVTAHAIMGLVGISLLIINLF